MGKILKFLKVAFCFHVFEPVDMQTRDENGVVVWPCCKCKHVFKADCGLDILANGRCTGNWEARHKRIEKEQPTPNRGH